MRIKLLLLLAVFAAPIAASYAAFFLWKPAATANYGELLQPTKVPDAVLAVFGGTGPFSFAELRGKWVLVHIDSGQCGRACQDKLYDMRQIRLAQGKDRTRVERVWLVDDDVPPSPGLQADFSGTLLVKGGHSPLLKFFPARDAVREHVYLIDPQGNLMMRYPPSPDPSGMAKDLKRLLSVSQVG